MCLLVITSLLVILYRPNFGLSKRREEKCIENLLLN